VHGRKGLDVALRGAGCLAGVHDADDWAPSARAEEAASAAALAAAAAARGLRSPPPPPLRWMPAIPSMAVPMAELLASAAAVARPASPPTPRASGHAVHGEIVANAHSHASGLGFQASQMQQRHEELKAKGATAARAEAVEIDAVQKRRAAALDSAAAEAHADVAKLASEHTAAVGGGDGDDDSGTTTADPVVHVRAVTSGHPPTPEATAAETRDWSACGWCNACEVDTEAVASGGGGKARSAGKSPDAWTVVDGKVQRTPAAAAAGGGGGGGGGRGGGEAAEAGRGRWRQRRRLGFRRLLEQPRTLGREQGDGHAHQSPPSSGELGEVEGRRRGRGVLTTVSLDIDAPAFNADDHLPRCEKCSAGLNKSNPVDPQLASTWFS
jgi:hypothetical protein